jgi:hypothetical protein
MDGCQTAKQNKLPVRRLVEEAVNPGNLQALEDVLAGEFAVAARRCRTVFCGQRTDVPLADPSAGLIGTVGPACR